MKYLRKARRINHRRATRALDQYAHAVTVANGVDGSPDVRERLYREASGFLKEADALLLRSVFIRGNNRIGVRIGGFILAGGDILPQVRDVIRVTFMRAPTDAVNYLAASVHLVLAGRPDWVSRKVWEKKGWKTSGFIETENRLVLNVSAANNLTFTDAELFRVAYRGTTQEETAHGNA